MKVIIGNCSCHWKASTIYLFPWRGIRSSAAKQEPKESRAVHQLCQLQPRGKHPGEDKREKATWKQNFRQFSGNPRKFHLKIAWLTFPPEYEQVNTEPTLKQHLPWSIAVLYSHGHWEPLLDINMEINWKCKINQQSEDPNTPLIWNKHSLS